MRIGIGLCFHECLFAGQGLSEKTDGMVSIELIFFDPVSGGGFTFGTALGPDVLEGVGEASKDAQDCCGIGLTNAAFILSVSHVQGVVGSVFDAPSLLFQLQPLGFTELFG